MRSIVLALLLSFAGVASAAAQTCRTELRPNDTFKELSEVLACLQKRIEVLEQRPATSPGQVVTTGPVGRPRAGSNPAPPATISGATAIAQGFRLQVKSCESTAGPLRCIVAITATEGDGVLNVFSDSAAFDDAGRKFALTSMRSGNRQPLDRKRYIFSEFIAGVPVDSEFEFASGGDGIRQLSALRLQVERAQRAGSSANRQEVVTFRNVPVK